MDQAELLRQVVQTLERLSIPYMVVGSLASSAYGEPRMTQDIDLVIDANGPQVARLCQAFSPDDFYVSAEAAAEAVRRRSRFNIIHSRSGNKIDLTVRRADPWAQTEFSRRQRVQVLPGLEGYTARPEDVMIGKMIYFQEGGSEKHLRDIASILKVSPDLLDRAYIDRWVGALNLDEVWQAVLSHR